MASIVPSLSPAGSTMVRPCQLWTVSMSGIRTPSLLLDSGWGWVGVGRLGPEVLSRRPTIFCLAVAAQAARRRGVELLGGGGCAVGRSPVAVLEGRRLGGLAGLLGELGPALLGLGGGSLPVALHGL